MYSSTHHDHLMYVLLLLLTQLMPFFRQVCTYIHCLASLLPTDIFLTNPTQFTPYKPISTQLPRHLDAMHTLAMFGVCVAGTMLRVMSLYRVASK